MQEPTQKPWGIILGIVLVASVLGGGLAWILGQSNSTQSSNPQTTETPIPSPTTTGAVSPTVAFSPTVTNPPVPTTDGTAQPYWLKKSTSKTEYIPQKGPIVAAKPSDAEALDQAFKQLLSGPDDTGTSTTIPKGTKLLNLALKADGVHVDLSKEFTAGGGSESMKGRLGQILYTATSLKADTPVWISVEGKPLEVLGGEGLAVDQPLTRTVFEKEY